MNIRNQNRRHILASIKIRLVGRTEPLNLITPYDGYSYYVHGAVLITEPKSGYSFAVAETVEQVTTHEIVYGNGAL